VCVCVYLHECVHVCAHVSMFAQTVVSLRVDAHKFLCAGSKILSMYECVQVRMQVRVVQRPLHTQGPSTQATVSMK